MKSKSKRTLAGFIFGVLLLYFFLPNSNPTQFEDLALGEATKSVYTIIDNKTTHCTDVTNSKECLSSYAEFGQQQDVIFWLGNSQVHAINQPSLLDETASAILHKRFSLRDQYFITFSQANANLQEHFILFAYGISKLPIKTLVLPVVFDDTREDGIRSGVLMALKDPKVAGLIRDGELGHKLINFYQDSILAKNTEPVSQHTTQKRVEKLLDHILSDIWSVWDRRPTYRGNLFGFLYLSRNWLFGISPSSIRKIIPGRYASNMQAFSDILDLAKINRIDVIVYIVPLRNDVKRPYDTEQYKSFKSEVELITVEKGFHFFDFENIVPADFWGLKSRTTFGNGLELDFMHFTAEGHSLLAESIHGALIGMNSKE